MEDNIIVVKPGVEPTIFYSHTCSVCEAQLEVKKSPSLYFACPWCKSNEALMQDSSNEIKRYNGKMSNTNTSPRGSTRNLLNKKTPRK